MEAKTESQAPTYPKLLIEYKEENGILLGFEQTARDLLAVQIGARCVLLPISLKTRLEEMRGEWIAATLIRGKYYLRKMLGEQKRAVRCDC